MMLRQVPILFVCVLLVLAVAGVVRADDAPASGGSSGSSADSSGGGAGGSTSDSGSSDGGSPTATTEPAPTDSPGISSPDTTISPSPDVSEPFPSSPTPQPTDAFSPRPPESRPPEFSRPPVPQGCREFVDSGGVVRVECERRQVSCPSFPEDAKNKCAADGGNPDVFTDDRGCAQFFCRFSEGNFNPVSGGRSACLPDSEQKQIAEKCDQSGGNTVWERVGGCNQPVCRYERQEDRRPEFACRHIQQKEEEQLRESCARDGRKTIEDFDNNGCRNLRCAAPGEERKSQGQGTNERGDYCPQDLPKQVYDRCAEHGGELIIDRSPEGCVIFQECAYRGREEQVFVREDEIQDVPDATVLLDMAFKLEELKIKFLELSKKTQKIADYYKAEGSDDEQRFRTVSSMFEAAADQVDGVRRKLRDRLQDLSRDDLVEIKYDIKSLVEVTLKDIVFYMLGGADNEEIQALKAKNTDGNSKSCGTNGGCFDKAIRRCSAVTFEPEGRNGPTIFVKGVEDGACVIRIENNIGQSPPGFAPGEFGMTCKVEKFASGISGPEDMFGGDGLPFCEGPMADFLRRNPDFLPKNEPRDDFQRPSSDDDFRRPSSDDDFRRPSSDDDFRRSVSDDEFAPRAGSRLTQPIRQAPPAQPATQRDTQSATPAAVNS